MSAEKRPFSVLYSQAVHVSKWGPGKSKNRSQRAKLCTKSLLIKIMALVKDYTDIEFLSDLNDIVAQKPDASQRDMGESIGISVAVVNGFLKRCMERGWIAVSNLNKRKLQYMLTAQGLSELTRRSFSFMRRNFEELSTYRQNILAHLKEAKAAGKTTVALYGESKVDFIIAECCREVGVSFVIKEADPVPAKDTVSDGEIAVIGEVCGGEEFELTGAVQTVFALARK